MIVSRVSPSARVGTRAFSTTLRTRKTLTETVKDKAQDINLKVGKGLAAGLETAEGATKATKEALGVGAQQTKKKAEETTEVGKQKANQASAEARSRAENLRERGQQELNP
ncbi:hypothetical protein CTheo_2189 [Ceratobasidium theobromae]|uniref:Uncharacterized protein n=1 Tax=Ceratobasidium theobromae TaxID=1582974 RepID=A0A5N5QRL9_9AGAM|nr:hypothetical protein CTheo_2189 [Ceratobasidium theobromae]